MDRSDLIASYIIGPQDMLAITVWHEADISGKVQVRPDGMISVPLVGDVEASGLTPVKLQAVIGQKLHAYMDDPEVTVVVEQVNSRKFNVLGEVQRPGEFSLGGPTRVLDAIAAAGGFRDFAKTSKIYVLRRDNESGNPEIFRFDYKQVIKGKSVYQNLQLQPGDTVVVP